ncbi:MAG TPA: glycosyltransferase family 39 protein [Thermoleophilia bacterium]
MDEAWSYVIATGHLGSFHTGGESQALQGRWVPASQWKQLWLTEKPFDFRQIASDLARYDVHPPLYFWLLHLWILLVGVHISTGPSLNIVIFLCTGVALFFMARRFLKDALAASFVVFIWSVTLLPRAGSSIARMYDLLALFAVLFVWLIGIWTDVDRRLTTWLYVALALATAGGLLVQYQFTSVVVGGLLYGAFRLYRRQRARLVRMALSMLAGVVMMAVAQPGFVTQFVRQSGRHLPYSRVALFAKVNSLVGMGFDFFGRGPRGIEASLKASAHLGGLAYIHLLSNLTLLVAGIALLILLSAALPWTRRPLFRWVKGLDKTGWAILFFLVWIGGVIVLQNLSFRTPPMVPSSRYFATVWPFLAFVPVFVLRAFTRRWYLVVLAVYCFAFLLPTSTAPVNYVATSGPLATLGTAHRAVFDAPLPGVLPVAMWFVPDDALVFVDAQAAMRDSKTLIAGLADGGYYVHREKGSGNLLAGLPLDLVAVPPRHAGLTLYRVLPTRTQSP